MHHTLRFKLDFVVASRICSYSFGNMVFYTRLFDNAAYNVLGRVKSSFT